MVKKMKLKNQVEGGKTMNKKGELGVGTLLMMAVGIIFAVVIIQQIGVNQGTATNLLLAYNESHILPNCFQNVTVATQVNTTNCPTCASIRNCNFSVTRISGYETLSSEWDNRSCPLTNFTIRSANSTAITLVDDTDFVLGEQTGVVSLLNTTKWYNLTEQGNRTFVDYNFCGVGYNTDSGARGVASMWLIFSVLGLLAFVLIGVRKDWFDFL